METAVIDREKTEDSKLDFHGAADVVSESFAWRPDPFARVLIMGLSRVMRPLEQGSYEGRALTGEPHRASWVIASPLNLFVLPSGGYWRRIVLAARLRHKSVINIVAVGKDPQAAADVLGQVIRIQRESDVALRLVPVAPTSHQLSRPMTNLSAAARAYRIAPQNLVRRVSSRLRTLRTGRVKNCSPVALSSWLESRNGDGDAAHANALRLHLMGNIESQHRACEGPGAVPSWEVKRRVLADPLLASYMQEYSLDCGMSRDAATEEAKGYIDEIASDYRVGVVRWFARAVDYMFDRFLSGLEVDREGIRFLSECESRSRLVLVCSHKSYIDPLLIGYTLFRSGLVPPQQAAGLNLNFWPVGWLLRHSGAFYLRRTFAGETLYREVFCAYVRYLLAQNYITVVYIEGTRSRDGKLARPKTGFMGILEDSLRMGICQDIKLIPVYLGYDRTPEESAHVREMAGGRKVSESVKGFSRIYKSVNTKLGRAYVRFGEPMSMSRLLGEHGLEKTCEIACEGINRVTPLTARGLAATALLAGGHESVTDEELHRVSMALLDHARAHGLPLAVDCDPEGIMASVESFRSDGHITRLEEDGSSGWRLGAGGRRHLEYNKNLTINHFLAASIEAVARRRGSTGDAVWDGQAEDARAFLQELFSEEFVFDSAASPDGEMQSAERSEALASILDSYLEGYMVAARQLRELPEAGMGRDEALELCMDGGDRMLKSEEIRRPESVSRTIVANAIRKYSSLGVLVLRREKVAGRRDIVTLERGPDFDELILIEERIRELS